MQSARRTKTPARIHANLTPLIDVTFLLIVFFVLVAQITNSQIVDEINLPVPEDAVSIEPPVTETSRLTLNVLPPLDQERSTYAYRLGSYDYSDTPTGIATLRGALRTARQKNPEIIVDLRADKATPYARIFPALNATADAGITRINLLVEATDDEPLPTPTDQNGG